MSEGVAGLAQGDERVGRRQVERRFRLEGGAGHAALSLGIAGATRGLGLVLSSDSSIEEGITKARGGKKPPFGTDT
jgi:hypothetical protein